MIENGALTSRQTTVLRVSIWALVVMGFLAGLALFRLHDFGLAVLPIVREALFVGTIVGLCTPAFTKFLRQLVKR
jgi:hypothetical protein